MPSALRMNRLALLLPLVLCLPLPARADDASRHAKAAQLVELLHTDRIVQQVSANVLKQVSDVAESALGASPTPENKAQLAGFEKKVSQLIDSQLGWKQMQPAFIDLYARNFTDAELDAIVAFYKTPAGIALLSKMPEIDAQANQLAQSGMAALQPQMAQLYDDFRKSLPTPAAASAPTASTPK